LLVAFLWGLAEATVFFIIPDVYIVFVALLHWRRGLWATLASVAGSIVGGTLMYMLAAHDGAAMAALLVHVPLISPQMVETVAQRMGADGLVAMINGPLQGIPYKVYAVQAGWQSRPFLPFLLITILARLERLLPAMLAGAVCGALFRNFIRYRTQLAMGAYASLWVGVYVMYYLQVR
jgi:membrane protein YqaA with SNARE-associated domain